MEHITQARTVDNSSPFYLPAADLAEAAKTRMETLASIQLKLLEDAQETARAWMDRMQAEAGLAAILASNVITARSVPEAVAAYQEWGGQQLRLVAQDLKHWTDKTQKFIKIGANFWKI